MDHRAIHPLLWNHSDARLLPYPTILRIADSTSWFRAFNREAVRFLALDYPGDYPEVEAIVVLARNGPRIREVSVQTREVGGLIFNSAFAFSLLYGEGYACHIHECVEKFQDEVSDCRTCKVILRVCNPRFFKVRRGGVEPPTYWLRGSSFLTAKATTSF